MDYKLVIDNFVAHLINNLAFFEICCEVTQLCYSFKNDSMHYIQMQIANTNR